MVKLSEGTIRKRLGDFKDTASSRLTIDEFLKIDLEQEHDPPSFNDAKKKSKQQQQQPQSVSQPQHTFTLFKCPPKVSDHLTSVPSTIPFSIR